MNKQRKTYSLLCRFESIVDQINNISANTIKLGRVRYKPIYANYNSCIDEFKIKFRKDFNKLNLEDLPLFDENGTMLFTNEKLSTVLHQSEMISAFLKGNLPPNYSGSPENIKESLSWYWQNTHWSVPIFFVLVLLGAIISGAIISETTLYKNTIKPFVIEYLDAKSPTKSKITPNTP